MKMHQYLEGMNMHKKIFTIIFLSLVAFAFVKSQKYFFDNNIEILKSSSKESALESAIPYDDQLKEIYGFSNKIISPNEKINGKAGVIKDADGYLVPIYDAEPSVLDAAKKGISELNEVCHNNGAEFMYVSYPSKINAETEAIKYGMETNYEDYRKDLLAYVDENNIEYLNLRKRLEDEGYKAKDIFYKTDHHWKTTAGFYAAKEIANELNYRFNWSLDTAALDEDRFSFTTYDNLWFGEIGRSLSKTWVNALDDFTLIMPNYETSISLSYPDGNEISGDFSVMVDSSKYEGDIDYYSTSAHYTYSKGMSSPTTYHNNLMNENGKKILIIKDSFSVVVVPFLTLETKEVTVWDMRKDATKNGLYQYIADNDFDVVLLAYTDFWRLEMWTFN